VVLIEVNTSPALFRAGKYLSDLLPRVVEEVVQKCVDPVMPPPPGGGHALPEPLDGFERMELIACEALSGAPKPKAQTAGGAAARTSPSAPAAAVSRVVRTRAVGTVAAPRRPVAAS
jgi:hypothetical protein